MKAELSLLLGIVGALVFGCAPVRFTSPGGILTYNPEFNVRMQPGASVTQFPVSGIRHILNPNDQAHPFNMDDNTDKFTLIILDQDGVVPNTSYTYKVEAAGSNGAAFWIDTITVSVPQNYPERVTRFEFVYSLGQEQPPVWNGNQMTAQKHYSPTANNPAGFVGGMYEFTTPDAIGRYVWYDLKFDLSDYVAFSEALPLQEQPPP